MDRGRATEALAERKSVAKKRAVDGRRRNMHLSGGVRSRCVSMVTMGGWVGGGLMRVV